MSRPIEVFIDEASHLTLEDLNQARPANIFFSEFIEAYRRNGVAAMQNEINQRIMGAWRDSALYGTGFVSMVNDMKCSCRRCNAGRIINYN